MVLAMLNNGPMLVFSARAPEPKALELGNLAASELHGSSADELVSNSLFEP